MIKTAIIGATGYVGSELARILASHPKTELTSLTSRSFEGKRYGGVFQNFRHQPYICEHEDITELAEKCDVIFLAMPHGAAAERVNKSLLEKTVVIDLGADFRLKNAADYEKWYEIGHPAKNLLKEAVYGLCEINRGIIKNSRLIANPGCYTTCSILAMYPLVKENLVDGIIIDAKSGVSGAGRSASLDTSFCETNENIKAYKIAAHRHTPEIEEQLSYAAGNKITLTFTPHLIPVNRGILATCYANLKKNASYEYIKSIYEKYYGNEYFIRLADKGVFPETKWVKGSNFTDIGFTIDERAGRIIVVSALDNLIKGAAGQAIQNMNIIFGLDEKTGIGNISTFPA